MAPGEAESRTGCRRLGRRAGLAADPPFRRVGHQVPLVTEIGAACRPVRRRAGSADLVCWTSGPSRDGNGRSVPPGGAKSRSGRGSAALACWTLGPPRNGNGRSMRPGEAETFGHQAPLGPRTEMGAVWRPVGRRAGCWTSGPQRGTEWGAACQPVGRRAGPAVPACGALDIRPPWGRKRGQHAAARWG